jgi:hypothetical protein
MGVDGHGLYRRPWQSTAGSGTRRVLATSWPASGTLVFLFFPRGLVSSDTFFHQCSLMRVFSYMTTCLPPPLPPPIAVCRPFQRDLRPPHIMANARNVQFVLFCAVGAARGTEMQPIKNREGRGILVFDGRHLNNEFNNQPKVGAIGKEDIREGARLWRNVWGGRFRIVCGG